jgi:hypothetical protein
LDRIDIAQKMVTNETRNSLQKICSSLNKNEVDYLIIGGVAVSFEIEELKSRNEFN